VFSEHYRQPVSELSVIAYAEDLADLTAEQLDAACKEARRTSEFMPVSTTIRAAHEKMRVGRTNEFLGVPLIEYPPITEQERGEALKFSEALKKQLAAIPAKPAEPKKLTIVPSLRSLEEQKAELRRKGFLK
jgi:hypothetical protein